MKEKVILLHGLGRRSASLSGLRKGLEKAGFDPQYWPYPSRQKRLSGHIDAFRTWLCNQDFEGPVHFIGHSLGGLVIRGALIDEVPFKLGRIILIATPNQGAGVVEKYENNLLSNLIFGKPLKDLSCKALRQQPLGVPRAEIGVISGIQRFHPLNPMSYINSLHYRGQEHDGTVELANTRLKEATDSIIVKAHHSFISNNPETISQAVHFLKTGTFDHRESGSL